MASARPIITAADGAPNYIMAYRRLDPGGVSPRHTHPGEHAAYILEGNCILNCDGKDYFVAEGDAVLAPPNLDHEWRGSSLYFAKWLVFNPL